MPDRLPTFGRVSAAVVAIIAGFAIPHATVAQVVTDHNLAGALIVEKGACSILRIEFYGRVQMHNHFPAANGEELKVNLKLIDRPVPPGEVRPTPQGDAKKTPTTVTPRREQVRAPANDRAAISSIELENAGLDQTLSIYFRHAVAFRVAPGKDPRTILVAIAGRAASATCQAVLDDAADGGASPAPKTPGQVAKTAFDADIVEARAAMAKGEHDRAIAYLTRVTEGGPSKVLPEALELLGLAREQKGHLAHARADYQSYIRQFPSGDGHARVSLRLAALDKREKGKQAPPPSAQPPVPATELDGKMGPQQADVGLRGAGQPSSHDARRSEKPEPTAWTVQHTGSLSTFYNLNQGGRDFFTRPNLQQGWEKENIYQTYRNSALTLGNYDGAASNAFYVARIRMSASHEYRFTDSMDEWRISSLNFESKLKEGGASIRVGRQSHYGGGVLGRFDGGVVTMPFAEAWKARVFGGSPVERSGDRPFLFDRVFYGASLDYAVSKKLDVGAFVIQQKTDDFTDRRAIGGEARYIDDTRHGFGSVDYDVYFSEINSVLGTGTVNFADKSSLTGTLDYRRSPTMFTTNALQGQMETKLSDLLRRYSIGEIEDLARDRTPKSTVASIAYSRFLRENLQATAELTLTNMSSMPESGGVAWTPSTGWDTYTMLQLMATDVFRENDSVTGSLRFATTEHANRTLVEGSVRLPTSNPNWRIGPQLRVGYASFKNEPVKEYIIHPMLRTSYNMTRDLLLEFELGKRWTVRDTYRGRENETDLLLLTGVRYDFHTSR